MAQANSLPVWIVPVQGRTLTTAVNTGVSAAAEDNGLDYRWDATARRYIYSRKTSAIPRSANA